MFELKKYTNLYILITLIFVLFLLLFSFSYGQSSFSEEEIEILMSPESPKPNRLVSFSVVSSSSNLNTSFITWTKNGVGVKSGLGETSYKTELGGVGERMVIGVIVSKEDESKSASISLVPGEVALIWEADSYTPIFYKGKGLASHQSEVRIIAIPNIENGSGTRLSSEKINYEWRLDEKKDNNQSGIGKNVFVFRGSLISRPKTVRVIARTNNGTSIGESVVINFYNPILMFYKENPLTGMRSNNTAGVGFVQQSESSFIVEPYFFSKKSVEQGLINFKWIVDGKSLDFLNKSKKITFGGDITGRSSISVEVSNPKSLLQNARRFFSVIVSSE